MGRGNENVDTVATKKWQACIVESVWLGISSSVWHGQRWSVWNSTAPFFVRWNQKGCNCGWTRRCIERVYSWGRTHGTSIMFNVPGTKVYTHMNVRMNWWLLEGLFSVCCWHRENGAVLVVSFAIFIFTRPDFRDLLRSIRSVQNYNRFLVYLTIYRSIEIWF